MRRQLALSLGVAAFALVACGGSGDKDKAGDSKPGCKLLYKRYDKCDKMPLTQKAFVKLCEKMKDRARTKAEIDCSKESKCGAFKKCLKAARRKGRAERMKKRWTEALAKAKKGKKGLWADPNEPVPPWEFRRGKRSGSASSKQPSGSGLYWLNTTLSG